MVVEVIVVVGGREVVVAGLRRALLCSCFLVKHAYDDGDDNWSPHNTKKEGVAGRRISII